MAARIGKFWLKLQHLKIPDDIGSQIDFEYDLMSVGGRFQMDMLHQKTLDYFGSQRKNARAVIPGCGACGEDMQFWLRHGFGEVSGVDLNDFSATWKIAIPILEAEYTAKISCQVAAMEDLPYESGSRDLVYTSATLEHVYNLDYTVAESYRVLRPGGLAVHAIGPLYFTHGGDHCISSYGLEHGYDHLLQDEKSYKAQIANDQFFATTHDPNQHWWAKHDQLSFLRPQDYLESFGKVFESCQYVGVEISAEALQFREAYPERWSKLINAGLSSEELLVKSLNVIYQKAP